MSAIEKFLNTEVDVTVLRLINVSDQLVDVLVDEKILPCTIGEAKALGGAFFEDLGPRLQGAVFNVDGKLTAHSSDAGHGEVIREEFNYLDNGNIESMIATGNGVCKTVYNSDGMCLEQNLLSTDKKHVSLLQRCYYDEDGILVKTIEPRLAPNDDGSFTNHGNIVTLYDIEDGRCVKESTGLEEWDESNYNILAKYEHDANGNVIVIHTGLDGGDFLISEMEYDDQGRITCVRQEGKIVLTATHETDEGGLLIRTTHHHHQASEDDPNETVIEDVVVWDFSDFRKLRNSTIH